MSRVVFLGFRRNKLAIITYIQTQTSQFIASKRLDRNRNRSFNKLPLALSIFRLSPQPGGIGRVNGGQTFLRQGSSSLCGGAGARRHGGRRRAVCDRHRQAGIRIGRIRLQWIRRKFARRLVTGSVSGGRSGAHLHVPDDHSGLHRPARPQGFAPIAIGLGLTLIHLIGIPVTNLSVNPARGTGPAVIVGGWAIRQLWLFWLAPIAGGGAVAQCHTLFRCRTCADCVAAPSREASWRACRQRSALRSRDKAALVVPVRARSPAIRRRRAAASPVTGPRGTAGTRPSPGRCEPAVHCRPAPGGSRSCPRSPETARSP